MTEKPKLSDVHIHKQIVQSYDLDFLQHVNNAVYLNYLESARISFLKLYGIDFKVFLSLPAIPVVATAHLEYKRPCFIDDELSIHTWVSEKKRVSMTIAYEIYNQANELVHLADTVLVFINKTGKASEIPQIYLDILNSK